MEQKKFLRDTVLQYAKAVVCGAVVIALLVIALIEMIPMSDVGVEVKDEVTVVSSQLYADRPGCTSHVRGILKNNSPETVSVESVRIVINDGGTPQSVEVAQGIVLAANAEYDLSLDFEGERLYDTVYGVYLRVGGVETQIANRSSSAFPLTGLAIGCIVLLIPASLLLVRSVKGCYYLYQERKEKEKSL